MTTTTISHPDENEVFEYMKKQYEEHRRIPDIDELTHKFIHLPWVEINDAIYEFDAWHDEVKSV